MPVTDAISSYLSKKDTERQTTADQEFAALLSMATQEVDKQSQ
jgi:hypothetical protein